MEFHISGLPLLVSNDAVSNRLGEKAKQNFKNVFVFTKPISRLFDTVQKLKGLQNLNLFRKTLGWDHLLTLEQVHYATLPARLDIIAIKLW